ncbi:hypothetical protein MMC25_002325 [Agyrium rufum]|nr:hypothetical protein [Agyrium rufum]
MLSTDKSEVDSSLPSESAVENTKTSPRIEISSAVKQPTTDASNDKSRPSKPASNAEVAQPLAPPPRPNPTQQNSDAPDYFSSSHNNSHFSLEPNPFEQSFGNPSAETPGKSLLPPVAALASPAPLTGNTSIGGGYNWSNSLRSGPLSPAMLGGPLGETGYFDSHIRGGFPTPNESSLRTGLTPGGGGSMFPAPSPNSQALFNQLANGGATPGTLDFHRTAMNAAAARKSENPYPSESTSQPQDQRAQVANMDQAVQSQAHHQHFGQHDSDAANGLYLLAQAGNENQTNNQFAIPNQPSHGMRMPPQSQETSPTVSKRSNHRNNGSIGGSLADSVHGASEMSGEISDGRSKSNVRGKAKRASSGKGPATNRRKAPDDTPMKQPAAKKAKTVKNIATSPDMSIDGPDTDDEQNIKEEVYDASKEELHESGRKMTDEEKRKNFLERNRVAALKCRQRKKQWLNNLQAKVEIFSSENDSLSATVAQLREEILNLKTILISHKDCPIAQNQIAQYASQGQNHEYNPHANPYNMAAMQNGQQVMAGPRRYS